MQRKTKVAGIESVSYAIMFGQTFPGASPKAPENVLI
jgi:hypothetical protein